MVGLDVGEPVGGNDSKPDLTGDWEGKTVGDALGGEVLGKIDGLLDGGLLGDFGALAEQVVMNMDSNEISCSYCVIRKISYNRR